MRVLSVPRFQGALYSFKPVDRYSDYSLFNHPQGKKNKRDNPSATPNAAHQEITLFSFPPLLSVCSELSFPNHCHQSPQEFFCNIPYFLSQQFLKISDLGLLLVSCKHSKDLKWNRVRKTFRRGDTSTESWMKWVTLPYLHYALCMWE